MYIVSVVAMTLVIVTVRLASTVRPRLYCDRYNLGLRMGVAVIPCKRLPED